MRNQPLKYCVKRYAVVDIARRYFHLQHIPALLTDRMRLICKALLLLALVEHAAFRIGGGLNYRFLFIPINGFLSL